jgi:hypothetical protein
VNSSELEGRWAPSLAEVGVTMAQWRRAHPRATLTEIEDALDERLAALRGQMLVDTALASQAASFAGAPATARPRCPGCDARLVSRGQAERTLATTRGQDLRLCRSYAHCPVCGLELFPPR